VEIREKTALVTGSAKRVGKAIALALAKKGANIIVHYNTSAAEAKKTAKEIEALGANAHIAEGDISKTSEAKRIVCEARNAFGSLDILVNNASIFPITPYTTVTDRDWDANMDVNAKSVFLFSKFAGDIMLKQKSGSIVNIADWAIVRPYRDHIPYIASKAAVVALTLAYAKELAPNVRVNCILPGPVLLQEGSNKVQRRRIADATLLKRIGTPEEIAHAVIFLCENEFITGACIPVDGGRTIA